MQIISGRIDFKLPEDTVVAIGKFDGIHKGHGKILKKMLEYKKAGLKMAVLTFDVPPASVFYSADRHVLTTNVEKRRIFEELYVDYLIEFPFDEVTAAIPAESFVEDYLIGAMRMKAVVVGEDCSFGYKGLGNADLLRTLGEQYHYDTVVIKKIWQDNCEISSTNIRKYIENSEISRANTMLLYPFFFYGEVVHGRKIGRTLGMPTINMIPEACKLLPKSGVYFSTVKHMGREYKAITNIGSKPTVSDDGVALPVIGVETYIYNFDDEIYGDSLYVSLCEFLRPEKKFESVQALKEQMAKDIEKGRRWHKKNI